MLAQDQPKKKPRSLRSTPWAAGSPRSLLTYCPATGCSLNPSARLHFHLLPRSMTKHGLHNTSMLIPLRGEDRAILVPVGRRQRRVTAVRMEPGAPEPSHLTVITPRPRWSCGRPDTSQGWSCQLTAAGRQHTWRSGSDSSLLNPDHVQIQLYSGGNTDRVRRQTAQEVSLGTEWYQGNEPVSKLRLRYSCPERQPKRRWLRWEKSPCAEPSANCLPHGNHKATEARPGTSNGKRAFQLQTTTSVTGDACSKASGTHQLQSCLQLPLCSPSHPGGRNHPAQGIAENHVETRDSLREQRRIPSCTAEQYHRLQEYFICLTAGCNNINFPKLHTSRKVIGTEQSVVTVTSLFKANHKRLKSKKVNNGTKSAASPLAETPPSGSAAASRQLLLRGGGWAQPTPLRQLQTLLTAWPPQETATLSSGTSMGSLAEKLCDIFN